VISVQTGEVGAVELERADRAHVQVGEVARYFAVNPILHFAVALPRRVRFYHQLDAVPFVSQWKEVWEHLEVWILRWIGQPLALVADVGVIRYHESV
jgi:hypothetical protein